MSLYIMYMCETRQIMAYIPNKNLKLYYSISEVAEIFGVNESLLRYWEKEFPQIAPHKNAKGTRQYTKEDIEEIRLVYHLVKERGMTLPGARQKLRDNREGEVEKLELIQRLKVVKEELMAMKKELEEVGKSLPRS